MSHPIIKLVVCVAQAAHWFNWDKLWKEAARVLRTDGSLAVWVRSVA